MRRQKYTLAPSLRIDSKKRDSSWRRSPEIRWQGLAFAALAACFGCGDTQTTAESDANVTLADAGEQQPDSGAGIDASFLDAAIDSGVDAGVVTMPTLPDYLGCERDSDCPVGLGNCITEIPFNLADSDGISSNTVQELFPDLTTAGICTLLCTDNALICDGLELQLGNGPSAKYSCQLITTGSAPYPAGAPGFPIAVD
ncbi:MAG: hypothetical protein JKY56_19510, partial [Kofleriaceae bacterium]|nr:hypothetical protein [Kofleriaceae bacterium]